VFNVIAPSVTVTVAFNGTKPQIIACCGADWRTMSSESTPRANRKVAGGGAANVAIEIIAANIS